MILVTGAVGYVGGHVVQRLLEQGHSVRALVREGTATTRKNAFIEHFPGVEVVHGDLLDERSLAEVVRGVDGLVHCAARMGYWSRQDRIQHRINVDGTVHLMRQARKKRVERIVHVSTIAAVGCNQDGTPLTEETPWTGQRRPRVNYVLTKREAEERVLSAARAGAPITVVNPAMMLGPRALDTAPRTVQTRAQAGRPRVPRGGSSVAHVRDVAKGIVCALEKGRMGERYILGGANLSWLDLFGALARQAGTEPPRGEYPLPVGRILERGATLLDHLRLSRPPWAPELLRMWGWYSCADSSKARDELGYVVPTLESVLEQLA